MKHKIYIIMGLIAVTLMTGCSGVMAGWVPPFTVTSTSVDSYTSIRTTPSGGLFIIYYTTTMGLREARRGATGGSWSHYERDGNTGCGPYNSLAFDKNIDMPYFIYTDVPNAVLKYSRGYTVIPKPDSYTLPIGGVPMWCSVAVGATGETFVALYNSTTGNLEYTGADGTYTGIDSTGDVGLYASVAVGADDKKYIAYYDSTNGDLKLAYGPSPWVRVVLDSTGNAGEHCSIGMSGNKFYISYSADTTSLRVAYGDSVSWNTKTIVTAGIRAGKYSSICVNPGTNGNSDSIYIAYEYVTATNSYAGCAISTNGGNTFITGPMSSYYGKYMSVALTSKGEAAVSFLSGNNVIYSEEDKTPPRVLKPVLEGGSPYINTFDLNLKVSAYDTQCGVDTVSYANVANMTGATNNNTIPSGTYTSSNYWASNGPGLKYIYVTATDTALAPANVSSVVYDTIIIDTVVPGYSMVTINTFSLYTNTKNIVFCLSLSDTYWDAGQFQPAGSYPGYLRYDVADNPLFTGNTSVYPMSDRLDSSGW